MTKLTKEKKLVIEKIKKASLVNDRIKTFGNNLRDKNLATQKLNDIIKYLMKVKAPSFGYKEAKAILRETFENEELELKSFVNSFRVRKDFYYMLTKENCDKILEILVPSSLYQKLDQKSDRDVHRLSNLRDKLDNLFISSLIPNLNEKITNKQLAGLVKTGKQFCYTKSVSYDKDHVKRGLILQSSAYKYIGECTYHILIETYFKRYTQINKQIKTFNRLYEIYDNNKKDLKPLDYSLIESLLKELKKTYISKLTTYDPEMKNKNELEKNDYIIIFEKKMQVLNEACKTLSLNRLINLGMHLLENDKEFIKSSLASNYFDIMNLSRPVPLLSPQQNYPYLVLANNTETVNSTYEGSYVNPDVRKEDFIHKYTLDPQETEVCLDFFENRYKSDIDSCLFIDFFFAFKFDIKYAIAEIRKNYANLADDLYNFMLDFDKEHLESVEKFIILYKDVKSEYNIAKKRKQEIKINKKKIEIDKMDPVIRLYQQIKSKKYTTAEAIYLLPIYSKFAYYVTQSVTTYTGRRFPISTGLDILYKPIRCIARVYDIYETPEEVIESYTRKLQLTKTETRFVSLIKTKESYEYLYKNKNDPNIGLDVHIKHYFNSLIKNNETIINLNLTDFNPANIKILCYDHGIDIYKAVRYLIGRESYKNGRNFTIEKDAMTSGTQLNAMVRKDVKVAYMSGLAQPEEDQCDDIYMHVIHRLNMCIAECALLLSGKIIEDNDVEKFKWLFKFIDKLALSKEEFLNEFLEFTSEFLNVIMERKVWKAIIMPQQYGMTSYSMRNVLKEVIMKKLGDYPKDKALIWISVYVEWYNVVIKKELPQTEMYLNTFKSIKKDIKEQYKRELKEYKSDPKGLKEPFINPVYFKTDTFSWEFKTYKLKDHKIKLRGQQMKLYIKSKELNIENMFKSLPPILIHAIDANIVHNLIINARICEYPLSTIHDCFLISSNHLVVLLLHAREAYIKVYNADLFREFILKNNFDKKYLTLVLDESHPDYLKKEDLIVIEKGGLFTFLT